MDKKVQEGTDRQADQKEVTGAKRKRSTHRYHLEVRHQRGQRHDGGRYERGEAGNQADLSPTGPES